MGSKARSARYDCGSNQPFKIKPYNVGDVVWYDCSYNAGLCRIYKIEWWDDPAPELFGKEKRPWYFIENIINGHKNEEFHAVLLEDKLGNLLYGGI